MFKHNQKVIGSFFLLREVGDYINSMKTAFDFNFDQAVKQLDII